MGYNKHTAKPKPGQWSTRYAPGYGHQVIDPQGQVHGTYTCQDNAQTACEGHQARADAAAKRMERPCMTCGTMFMSEGIHNRLCPAHRNRSDGWDPHGIAPRSGRAR